MRLVKPSFEILQITPDPLGLIEVAGRTCYKSEAAITEDSKKAFTTKVNKLGHHSVVEHSVMTVRFIANRGFTHELVRHRLASYSQESTRYCNYKGGVTFVIPPWLDVSPIENGSHLAKSCCFAENTIVWLKAMDCAETSYLNLLDLGQEPQQARGVLPIDLKTEIVMTANLREWGHVFKLRTQEKAHPQMRELMIPLFKSMTEQIPELFNHAG